MHTIAERVTRDEVEISYQLPESGETIATLNSQLAEIKKSKAWKVVTFLRRVRVFVAPPNSRRERMIQQLINFTLLKNRKSDEI
jgi:hypothetical protein